MRYINGKELLMFLEPPITRLSVFEAETIDAALIMCAEAFKKIEKQCKIGIDFPTFKFQLLKTMSEFLSTYKSEHEDYLKQPRKHVSEEEFCALGADVKQWGKQLQKLNAENYFLISYALTYADILKRYLIDCGVPKEFSHHLANEAAIRLGDWIAENCIKKCNYECIRRSYSNGYCTLCSFMIQPLPCPKNNEIPFARIQLNSEELQCMRR